MLDLSENNIAEQGAEYLADALRSNRVSCEICVYFLTIFFSFHTDTHISESKSQSNRM
jgi:hypothetical protein